MWAVVCWEERCMTTRKNGCEGDFCLNSCTFRSLSSFKELPLLVRRSRRISKDSSSRRIINNYWMRFLRLITLTETLMILDVTKTESNNCFIIHWTKKMEVMFLLLNWRQATQSARTWHDYPWPWVSLTRLLYNLQRWRHRALISKIHCTLSTHQNWDSEFNV